MDMELTTQSSAWRGLLGKWTPSLTHVTVQRAVGQAGSQANGIHSAVEYSTLVDTRPVHFYHYQMMDRREKNTLFSCVCYFSFLNQVSPVLCLKVS